MAHVKIPSVGESISEVTIASWLKADGDYVEMDEPICEIESDKASVEIPAESAGTLTIKAQEGDTVEIGAIVAEIDESASAPAGAGKKEEKKSEQKQEQTPVSHSEQASSNDKPYPSPAAKKILDEKGVAASEVNGSGKDGRITKADAQSATAASSKPSSDKKPERKAIEVQTPGGAASREVERKKMSSLRKTIAKRLLQAKNGTAMLTTFNEVDMYNLMNLRKKYKEAFKEKHEIGLGFMSFFTKACTMALRDFPGVNGQIEGEEFVYHDYADVGIAVSTPKGLVVPVIRNAESLSIAQLEKEVMRLALKGRDGKLTIDEMQGGTFTVTNGGVFGSMLSTPIINAPQSAILGMHNIVERPVAINGEVKIRPVMYIALSYDHRIIDGKDSVSFLKKVKELIEDPHRLLLDV